MIMPKGVVFNIQRFSVHDGPGIRTTVFLKGCPLRCKWCHNPEGLSLSRDIEYIAAKCIGCGRCAAVCPSSCHTISDGAHFFDRTSCVKCGECVEACVAEAILMRGIESSVDDVMKVVRSDKMFYADGGGMTLSGGEPLMQSRFAKALLSAAHEEEIHTAVETCGYYPAEVLDEVLPFIDLFLFDYKVTGEEEHIAATGVSQKIILENLERICNDGVPVVLRCPIIPGVNNNSRHFDAIAALAEKYDSVIRIDLEPYHDLGSSKYQNIGLDIGFSATAPKQEEMDDILNYISSRTSKKTIIS